MSEEKQSNAFRDKIFPAIHKKINPAYISCIQLKKEQLELEKLREQYTRKKSEARQKVDELAKKCSMVEKKKQEESMGIISIMEQTEKKIEKIEQRNDQYKKLQVQMEEMIKSLEEKVEVLEQKKVSYLEHVEMHRPCKDLITAVTKIWPTVITEFELLKRLQALIKHKVRFTEEYQELYKLHESERKKLLYETAHDSKLNMIILSNKLDELEQERKDVVDALQKEEETFHRMMDTSSEVEAALSEVRLGCLRLYNLTKSQLKIWDPFEQLTIVQEFGLLLRSVAECLEQPSKLERTFLPSE